MTYYSVDDETFATLVSGYKNTCSSFINFNVDDIIIFKSTSDSFIAQVTNVEKYASTYEMMKEHMMSMFPTIWDSSITDEANYKNGVAEMTKNECGDHKMCIKFKGV